MKKVIRKGKVAVLYSPGFGAGWYSWNDDHEVLLFDSRLVKLVEKKEQEKITDEYMKKEFGLDFYTGGAEQLEIEWIEQGM